MPSKSKKQQDLFKAAMGAKKGNTKVKGAAKKVAKEMPEKEIKKFLKKESYDELVNDYLKNYLIEAYVEYEGGREYIDPREGFDGDDPTEYMGEGKMSVEEMREVVAREAGEEEAAAMSDNEIQRYYYAVVGVPEGNITPQEMYDVVAAEVGEQKASMMSGEEIKQYYYDVVGSYPPDEDYEEECESAKQGCDCGGCPACSKNDENKMLEFYGFPK